MLVFEGARCLDWAEDGGALMSCQHPKRESLVRRVNPDLGRKSRSFAGAQSGWTQVMVIHADAF